MGAVSRLENGWISGSWGFDSLSFRLEAWPSWKGSALLARRRHRRSQVRVLLPPLHRCDVVQTGGPPAVNRWMLVRAQPSQLSRPGRPADRGCRSLTPATRVRIPLGASLPADVESAGADPTSRTPPEVGRFAAEGGSHARIAALHALSRSRTRLGMRPGCLPGEAGSIPVESAISPSLSGRAPRSYRGPRGFESSRRDCVARLVASPRAVNPWSRVRFPGDA